MQTGEYHCLICHDTSACMEMHKCPAKGTDIEASPCTPSCGKYYKGNDDKIYENWKEYYDTFHLGEGGNNLVIIYEWWMRLLDRQIASFYRNK